MELEKSKRSKNEIIVKYKNSSKKNNMQIEKRASKKLLSNKKLKKIKKIPNQEMEVIELNDNEDYNNIVNELIKDSDLEYVQPNYDLSVFGQTLENDVMDNLLTYDKNTELLIGHNINITEAWKLTNGSPDIIIGVLGTGVDINHPDIKNNILINTDEVPDNGIDDDGDNYVDNIIGWDFVNNDNSVFDSENDSHETHIAGILSAEENGEGIIGITPNSKILSLKFIEGMTGSTSDAIEAINYAKAQGVRIITCSWGSYEYNRALKDAMENSGIIFVCAAGNDDSTEYVYPASFDLPNVISVSALDENGKLAKFSNNNDKVQVSAPGVDIYSTFPNNTYNYQSGTSFAVPFVAGVAALILSYDSTLSADEICNSIKSCNIGKTEFDNVLKYFKKPSENKEEIREEVRDEDKEVVTSFEKIENIKDLFSKVNKFSEASVEQRTQITELFNKDDIFFIECEDRGLSLTQSVNVSTIVSGYGFSFDETVKLMLNNDVTDLMNTLKKLRMLRVTAEMSENEYAEIKTLFVNGESLDKIVKACCVAKVLEVNVGEVIENNNINANVNEDLLKSFGQDEIIKLKEFSIKYGCDINWFTGHINRKSSAVDIVKEIEALYGKFEDKVSILAKDAQNLSDEEINSRIESNVVDYDKYTKAPFDYMGSKENVELSTGFLTNNSVDLQLKGKNGMDLVLLTRYDSSAAGLYKKDLDYDVCLSGSIEGTRETFPTYEMAEDFAKGMVAKSDVISIPIYDLSDPFNIRIKGYDYIYINIYARIEPIDNTEEDTYNELQNSLGAGWSFGFSSIEVDGKDKYLHLSDGKVYKINITDEKEDSNLEDYKLKDIRLETDSSYKYTTTTGKRVQSSYVLISKDGRKEYFSEDGRLLCIKDRFENTIKFEHQKQNGHYVICKIIDSVDRVIDLEYITTASGKEINVKNGDKTLVKYVLEAISGYPKEYKLVKKVDQEQRETKYEYEIAQADFSFFSKDSRNEKNYNLNLKRIHYPTKAYTEYGYEKFIGNLGSGGSEEYYRIKERQEYDNSKSYNKFTYKYEDNFTGYPKYKNPDNLSSKFYYYTAVEDINKQEVKYKFNNEHLKVEENKRDLSQETEKVLESSTYDYFDNKLIKMITRRIYSNQYGDVIKDDKNINKFIAEGVFGENRFVEYTESFEYDENGYGDLVGYWDISTKWDSNKKPLNDEHKTTYSYDTAYHLLTSKQFKKDSSTKIKEEYILNDDKKTVKYAKVFENDELKKKTEYGYDQNGNVIKEIMYLSDGTNEWSDLSKAITTDYDYKDNSPDRNGQFDGAYLTKKSISNVKDADGNLITAKKGNNNGVVDEVFVYDWYGNLKIQYDREGNPTQYQYDDLGRIKKIIHCDDTFREWNYYDEENRIEIIDERGNKLENDYDGLGNLIFEKVFEPKSKKYQNIKQSEYTPYCQVDWMKDIINDSITDYSYYNNGKLESKSITNNKTGKLLYQENWSYLSTTSLDALSPLEVKEVLGDENSPTIITKTFKNAQDLVSRNNYIYNENGISKYYTETFNYDYIGNKISECSARAYDESWSELCTTEYRYNHEGKVIEQYNVNKDHITTVYDALGRVESTTDIKGNKSNPKYSKTYEYDNLGRVICEKTPFVKDNSGKIIYSVKKYYYDRNGNVIREKITNNKPNEAESYSQTDYEYNPRNMLTMVITYDGANPENYTQYYYDEVGNKVRMYTGLNKPLKISGLDKFTPQGDTDFSITKYEYNYLNKISKVIDPRDKEENYEYDLAGNLKSKTDRNNNTTSFEYDALGNILNKKVLDINKKNLGEYTFTYTLTGKMLSMTGGGNTTNYKYDGLGRLVEESDSTGVIKKYTYDANNNKKSFTMQKGSKKEIETAYNYDKQNRLEYVYENSFLIAHYKYDDNGNRESLSNSNNTSVKYAYNLANQLVSLINKSGDTTLSNYEYSYYLDSNQESKTDLAKSESTLYTYDGLGRLSSETIKDSKSTVVSSIVYKYDDYNNRETMTIEGESKTSYLYDKSNRLYEETKTPLKSEVGSSVTKTSYGYDENGNMKSKQITKGEQAISSTIYEYDGFDQLTKVTEGTSVYQYFYRGDGLRHKKIINDIQTDFVWNDQNIVAELNKQGDITNKYIRGTNLIYMEDTTHLKKFYMFNGHGDVIHLVDESGSKLLDYNYDAFGNLKTDEKYDTIDKLDTDIIWGDVSGDGYVMINDSIIIRDFVLGYISAFPTSYGAQIADVNGDGVVDLEDRSLVTYYVLGAISYFPVDSNSNNYADDIDVSNEDNNPFRYCGEYWDKETGTIYLRARYYSPAIGRFITEDSFKGRMNDALSLNLYTYGHNNPIKNIDPTGHDIWGDVGQFFNDLFSIISVEGDLGAGLGGSATALGCEIGGGLYAFRNITFENAGVSINAKIKGEANIALFGLKIGSDYEVKNNMIGSQYNDPFTGIWSDPNSSHTWSYGVEFLEKYSIVGGRDVINGSNDCKIVLIGGGIGVGIAAEGEVALNLSNLGKFMQKYLFINSPDNRTVYESVFQQQPTNAIYIDYKSLNLFENISTYSTVPNWNNASFYGPSSYLKKK